MLLTGNPGDPDHIREMIRMVRYPLAFVTALCASWWYKRKQKIALAWPTVEGHVQFTSIAPVRDSSAYSATLQYSYFVGEYQSGSYTEVFDSENGAIDFTERMKDQKVPVRYNPRKPDDSLIEEADVEQYVQLPPVEREVPLR